MIPVRVPASTTVHHVSVGRQITDDHPLAFIDCPVCDNPLIGGPLTLVYVGTAAEDREGNYWTGAAVAVHDSCAAPATEAHEPARSTEDAPPLAEMVGAIPNLTGGLDPVDHLAAVRGETTSRERAVIDAARAWRPTMGDKPEQWATEQDLALIGAVDAYLDEEADSSGPEAATLDTQGVTPAQGVQAGSVDPGGRAGHPDGYDRTTETPPRTAEAITAAAEAISRYDWDAGLSANGEVSRHQHQEATVALAAAYPILAAQITGKPTPTDNDQPATGHRTWEELRTSGLLWLLNRVCLHPRGYALALVRRDGQYTGWRLLGDGQEVWSFCDDEDDSYAAVEATLRQAAIDNHPAEQARRVERAAPAEPTTLGDIEVHSFGPAHDGLGEIISVTPVDPEGTTP